MYSLLKNSFKNQRPPAKVTPEPSRGHPHTPALLVVADCDGENAETDTCWDFARDCGYISAKEHTEMTSLNHEVGKMLGSMISNPE